MSNDKDFRVVISISYGDATKPAYKHTRHFMTYEGEVKNEEMAKTIADTVASSIVPVFGLYKEEFPLASSFEVEKSSKLN